MGPTSSWFLHFKKGINTSQSGCDNLHREGMTILMWGFPPPSFLILCPIAHIGLYFTSTPGCPWTFDSPGLSSQVYKQVPQHKSQQDFTYLPLILASCFSQWHRLEVILNFRPISSPTHYHPHSNFYFLFSLLILWVIFITYKFILVIQTHIPITKQLK